MVRFFCLLLAFAASAPAVAATWIYLIEDTEGTVYTVDIESIAPRGKHKKAWFKTAMKTPQTLSYPPYKNYQSSKMLYHFDCAEKTSALVQSIYYAGKETHEVVSSQSTDASRAVFTDVAPETIGEVQLNAVCTYRKPK